MAERATSRTRSFSLLRGAIIACAIVAPIAGAIPTAAEEAAVTATKCDRLAGSTDDPNRVAPGVAYEEIPTRVAIATCVADLGKAPNTPRLQFNLARARARAGQSIQAIQPYTAAADRGMTLAQVRMAWLLLGGPDRLPRDIGEAVRNLKLAQARGPIDDALRARGLYSGDSETTSSTAASPYKGQKPNHSAHRNS